MKNHWTTTELAELAGVSSARIRQLLLEGRLTGQKLGPIWAIGRGEVKRFLSERGQELQELEELEAA